MTPEEKESLLAKVQERVLVAQAAPRLSKQRLDEMGQMVRAIEAKQHVTPHTMNLNLLAQMAFCSVGAIEIAIVTPFVHQPANDMEAIERAKGYLKEAREQSELCTPKEIKALSAQVWTMLENKLKVIEAGLRADEEQERMRAAELVEMAAEALNDDEP